eukprot:7501890-Pyramimonas_sp.AAC.1
MNNDWAFQETILRAEEEEGRQKAAAELPGEGKKGAETIEGKAAWTPITGGSTEGLTSSREARWGAP